MAQQNFHFTFEPRSNNSDDSSSSIEFDVVEFTLSESLNEPFVLHIDLLSKDSAIDFSKILDQPAVLTIWNDKRAGAQAIRYIHGLVSDFSQGNTGHRRTRYCAVLEPQLARTRLASNWRIFQQTTVEDILDSVFKADHISNHQINTQKEHLTREYCVQAGVKDFDFIQRLACEEGFVYAFEHSLDGHRLLMTDTIQTLGAITLNLDGSTPPQDTQGNLQVDPVLYNPMPAGDRPQPALHTFTYKEKVKTAQQTQRDYTFKNPRYNQEHSAIGRNMVNQSTTYEVYQYPGRYKADAAGHPFTQTKIKALRNDAKMAVAIGDDARIQVGFAFEMKGHPRSDLNIYWRPVRIVHTGKQHTAAEEEATGATVSTSYTQTAELVPANADWKATFPLEPFIHGPLIGHVTGPSGEEIFTDEFARVKIQFPWDRVGNNDEHSSCWIRVAQNWAGAGWGHIAIPRVGQEVIVDFLNGDEDQPIITGRTYDAVHPTPYKLPALKAQQTTKSKEHKGSGYNELLIDDTTGEIKTQLHTTHSATQLTMGFLTHPRTSDGNGEYRGDGFELRSDSWGAIRAGKGLYLSSNEQKEAKGTQLDLKEAIEQLSAALATAQRLAGQAEKSLAIPAEIGDQEDQFNDVFTGLKKAGILTSSAAGTAITTAQNAQISAERNIALTSGKSTDISSTQNFTVAAGNAVSLFAAVEGMKLFASKGDVQIQAQQNAMALYADKKVEIISANDKIEVIAKKEILLTSGGAYIRLKDGDIEIHAPGKIEHKGSTFPFMGPTSLIKNFDEMPTSALNDECFELKNENGKPIVGAPYVVHLKGDPEKVYASGITDAKGKTVRSYSVNAEELEVQWFVTTHDPKVQYTKGKKPPEGTEAQIEQASFTSPLPAKATGSANHPDLEAIANDKTVATEMDRVWNQSNPNNTSGNKKEHGFWIMKDQNTGVFSVKDFPSNTATNDSLIPGPVPSVAGKDVVGFYHTHPNTAAEGYVSGPSSADSRFSQGTGVPGIIRSHDGMYYFDK